MGSAAGDGIHSVLPLDLLFPRPFSHVHYLHLLRTSSKDRARFPVPFHVLVLVISAPGYLYSGVTFPGCRCSPAFAMLCCLRLPLLFTPVPTVPAADGRSLPAHMHCANRVKPWPHRTVKDPPPLSISPPLVCTACNIKLLGWQNQSSAPGIRVNGTGEERFQILPDPLGTLCFVRDSSACSQSLVSPSDRLMTQSRISAHRAMSGPTAPRCGCRLSPTKY